MKKYVLRTFFGKSPKAEKGAFTSQNYFSAAEVSHESEGVHSDQITGSYGKRHTGPKKAAKRCFPQTLEKLISSTGTNLTKMSPQDPGNKFSFTEHKQIVEKLVNCFSKSILNFFFGKHKVPKNLKWPFMLAKRFAAVKNRGRRFRFEKLKYSRIVPKTSRGHFLVSRIFAKLKTLGVWECSDPRVNSVTEIECRANTATSNNWIHGSHSYVGGVSTSCQKHCDPGTGELEESSSDSRSSMLTTHELSVLGWKN